MRWGWQGGKNREKRNFLTGLSRSWVCRVPHPTLHRIVPGDEKEKTGAIFLSRSSLWMECIGLWQWSMSNQSRATLWRAPISNRLAVSTRPPSYFTLHNLSLHSFSFQTFFTKIYLYQFIKIVDPDRLNFSRYWLYKRIQYVAIANISVLIDDVPVLDGHVGLFSSFSFFFLNSFFCSPIHSLLMKVWCRASYSDNESTNNDNDDIIFFSSSVLSLTFSKYSFFFMCTTVFVFIRSTTLTYKHTHTYEIK